jgi:hypothetical protein
MAKTRQESWLVLVHQLPAKPAYQRVKIWRRLRDAGTIALKNAVYVLPASETARALFTDLAHAIEAGGGECVVYDAELAGGMRSDQLRALFNNAREADFHAVTAELRKLGQARKNAKTPKTDPVQALTRMSERLEELAKIDFFGASGRHAAEALLAQLEHSHITREPAPGKKPRIEPIDMTGRTWVTRQDIHVDRIACAWLIKRFIDPAGTLKFVPGKHYAPQPGEYRYDMTDAEFTHEGEHCSFETIVSRAGMRDPAMKAVAEIVHDIDIKDGKFGHPETAGIAHVLAGICRTQGHDEARVERGSALFDQVYEQFRKKARRKN